jgi:hypothetical protein
MGIKRASISEGSFYYSYLTATGFIHQKALALKRRGLYSFVHFYGNGYTKKSVVRSETLNKVKYKY